MNNIETFSMYTARIFDNLYDSFPIPAKLDRAVMIEDNLYFGKDEELKDLKLAKEYGDILKMGRYSELEDEIEQARIAYSDLEREKANEVVNQATIFDSTLEFLVSEGLVREYKHSEYVLTAKAFSHLNKKFSNGAVEDEERTYIKTIKSILSHSAATAGKEAIGAAVGVVPSLLSM